MSCLDNTDILRIVGGNSFQIAITVKARRVADGSEIEDFDLSASSPVLNLIHAGEKTRKYFVTQGNQAIISFDGSEGLGYYGMEMSGSYNSEAWRFCIEKVLQLVDTNAKANIPEWSVLVDDTYFIEGTISIYGGGGGGDTVQADWTETNPTSAAFILHKPDLSVYATKAEVASGLAGKQDTIVDLTSIRYGAAAGATAYQKPSSGIPESDMSEGVQTSLDKADSAYQKPASGIPATDMSENVQAALEKADSAVQTESDPVFSNSPAAEITQADINNWNAKQPAIADLADIREGAAAGASAVQPDEMAQAIDGVEGDIEDINAKIPTAASNLNQLADKAYVNSSIATNSATYRGSFNLITDLGMNVDATHAQIAGALATAVATADNNDYAFVQIPDSASMPTVIAKIERYKHNGTGWVYEYDLNNSGFTAAQWAAINSGITSGLVGKLSDLPNNSELATLLNGKQNVINDLSAIRSGASAGATAVQPDEMAQAIDGAEGDIDAINAKIPTAASSLNQLADKAYVNSSIATNSATYRGSFNLITDLGMNVDATHAQIAGALATAIATADNNDYAFVQIPDSASTPTVIAKIERYKHNGSGWVYEYDLNNSGFTAAQWAAINSGITSGLVGKLADLPNNSELATLLNGKQNVINDLATIRSGASAGATAYQKPSGGIPASDMSSTVQQELSKANTAVQTETDPIFSASPAANITAQNIQTWNGEPAARQAADTALQNSVSTLQTDLAAETSARQSADALLQQQYNALTQSDIIVGTLPATGVPNVIYRVPGTTDFTDYMWYDNQFVPMATYGLPISAEFVEDSNLNKTQEEVNGNLYGGAIVPGDSDSITLNDYMLAGVIGARGFSNEEDYAWRTNGNIRCGYISHEDLESIREDGYTKLKVTGPPIFNGRITFVKKFPEPTLGTQTYQQLVAGGYLCSVHNSYQNVWLSVPAQTITEFDIPDDAYAVFFVYRAFTDGSSESPTQRKPSAVVATAKRVKGDIQTLQEEVEELRNSVVGTDKIADGAVTSQKIADASVTSEKIADGAITSEKIADGVIDNALADDIQTYVGYNLLNPATSSIGYIRRTNGQFVPQSSGIYATDYIPVNGKDIKAYNAVTYGSDGGYAVYDSTKTFIRGGTTQQYTYQAGDYYVRFSYKTTITYQFILYGSLEVTGAFNPTYDEQTIKGYSGDVVFGAKNLPDVMPAMSLAGQDGLADTISTLSGTYATLDNWPHFIKNGQTVTVRGNLSAMQEIRVGFGRQDTNGFFARVTGTRLEFCRFTDYVGGYETIEGVDHNITISDYISVAFKMSESNYKIIFMSLSGMHTLSNTFASIKENYGIPFVEAVGSSAMTSVSIRAVSETLRLPIWVVGDSYTSLYEARWTYQLISTCGISKFLVDGLAGGKSGRMFAELEGLLTLGTPKYLVWCLGMNDTPWNWEYYEKKIEMLCRAKGITLILQTIPWPTGGDKSYINDYIKTSGYRYIDVYSALSSDAQGTWKSGYNADGTHTTVLGAKAQAAEVLCDFPEIIQ